MISAMRRAKVFQFVECTGLIEGFCVQFDGGVRRENASTSARTFFVFRRVWSRIRAKEEFGTPRRSRPQQRYAVNLCFENLMSSRKMLAAVTHITYRPLQKS